MYNASIKNFGVIIAFLLPGFIATSGAANFSPLVESWLNGGNRHEATIGGMLFVTIFSLGSGLFFSTIRWLLIDTVHHLTGIKKPSWDYRQLQSNIEAYQLIEESHYRFYQFYGNSICALIFTYLTYRFSGQEEFNYRMDFGLFFALLVLFLGSRDALRKYYGRVNLMFNPNQPLIPPS